MNLIDAITEFDLSMAGGVKSEASRKLYAYTTRQLQAHFGGETALEAISLSGLRRWRAGLDQSLSVYTLHRHIRQCRRFFKWCVEEELLEQSPATRLDLPKLPKGEPPKAISEIDMERVIEAGRQSAPRDYAIVRFLAETGCRVAGLVGLRFGDLDLDRCRALVTEKGHKTRTVAFGEETVAALRAWLVERPRDKWGDVVFTGRQGPLTTSGVYRVLEKLARQSGVEGRFNPHSFRHALARRLLENGADMGTVSQLLGHSDIETTHRFYARWTEAELVRRHRTYGGILAK